MTTEQRKEDLRDEFYDKFCYSQEGQFRGHTDPFDFFWAEIEARDNKIKEYFDTCVKNGQDIIRLEEIIKAADEVIGRATWNQGDSYHEAKEHYNKLKSKT